MHTCLGNHTCSLEAVIGTSNAQPLSRLIHCGLDPSSNVTNILVVGFPACAFVFRTFPAYLSEPNRHTTRLPYSGSLPSGVLPLRMCVDFDVCGIFDELHHVQPTAARTQCTNTHARTTHTTATVHAACKCSGYTPQTWLLTRLRRRFTFTTALRLLAACGIGPPFDSCSLALEGDTLGAVLGAAGAGAGAGAAAWRCLLPETTSELISTMRLHR